MTVAPVVTERPLRTPRPRRVTGIDVARGVAIVGMVGAHALGFTQISLDPSTWYEVFSGRPMILFFLLAGVSIGLLTGGTRHLEGDALVAARLRLGVRAVLIIAIGIAIQGASIINWVLLVHGTLFLAAQAWLQVRPRRLLIAAAVTALTLPPLVIALSSIKWALADTMGTLLTACTLVPVSLLGLALSRHGDWTPRGGRRLLLAGLPLAALGYGLSGALIALTGENSQAHVFLDASDHTGTSFEILGSTGVALALLGLCLLLPAGAGRVTAPLRAAGAMPLTVVIAHAWLHDPLTTSTTTLGPWAGFAIEAALLLTAATLWRQLLGQGPLERLLALASDRLAPRPTVARDTVPS